MSFKCNLNIRAGRGKAVNLFPLRSVFRCPPFPTQQPYPKFDHGIGESVNLVHAPFVRMSTNNISHLVTKVARIFM